MLTIFKIKFLGTYVITHLFPHSFRKGPSSKLGQQLQIGVTKFYVLICKLQLESENQKTTINLWDHLSSQ